MTTPLSTLAPGRSGTIHAVSGDDALTLRLLEMGFVPGVRVDVVKRAPAGDPLELRLRGYHVSIRKSEAARITVFTAVSAVQGGEARR